jgi:hypothetical protein
MCNREIISRSQNAREFPLLSVGSALDAPGKDAALSEHDECPRRQSTLRNPDRKNAE